jgi:hypothetical protein
MATPEPKERSAARTVQIVKALITVMKFDKFAASAARAASGAKLSASI